jgi:hypothetical protein
MNDADKVGRLLEDFWPSSLLGGVVPCGSGGNEVI